MPDERLYVSRITRLPLLDNDGQAVGRIVDLVIIPPYAEESPHVAGFVAVVQRRRIFLSAGRVAEVGPEGVRLRSAMVDLRRFELRPGETLTSRIIGETTKGHRVVDVAVIPAHNRAVGWDVASVALSLGGGGLRRRPATVVDWNTVPELFSVGSAAVRQMAAFRSMNPADLAAQVNSMSPARVTLLTQAMADEELADVLEEMSEEDQVRLLDGMDLSRVADVVEEMEPDDAADLLAEMPPPKRDELLAVMAPEDAESMRRLLGYGATTAGGLMTPEPLILTPEVPVAEALARMRDHDVSAAIAAQVFVCEPPVATPTGRYLGAVGFQRLLRKAPSELVGDCIDESGFVKPDLPEERLAEQLAAYDLIALAVCDDSGRLLGAVTVDDVLDRTLPVGWRRRRG